MAVRQEATRHVKADEPDRTGDENPHRPLLRPSECRQGGNVFNTLTARQLGGSFAALLRALGERFANDVRPGLGASPRAREDLVLPAAPRLPGGPACRSLACRCPEPPTA